MTPIRKRKSLGQHFLRDAGHAQTIADYLQLSDQWQRVLEVGPGGGQLTETLFKKFGDRLWVVELDDRFAAELADRFPDLKHRIIQSSVLDIDLSREMGHQPFAVIGNFPYQISTEIVFKVLENKEYIPEAVGMFQREVALRLAANPGNKQYGITSVLTQVYYEVEYMLELGPEEFSPPPKVHSAVVRMTRRPKPLIEVDYKRFRRVVKRAFNQRRKILRNALKPLLTDQVVDDDTLKLRAEQLSISDFERLTRVLLP